MLLFLTQGLQRWLLQVCREHCSTEQVHQLCRDGRVLPEQWEHDSVPAVHEQALGEHVLPVTPGGRVQRHVQRVPLVSACVT